MVKRKRRKSGREFYCVLGSKKTQKDTSNNRYNSWDCANGKAKPWPGYVCAGCKAFTCNDCAEKLLNVISATCAKSPRGSQYADTDSVCIGIRNALAGGQVNEPSVCNACWISKEAPVIKKRHENFKQLCNKNMAGDGMLWFPEFCL